MSNHRGDSLFIATKQLFGPRWIEGQLNPVHLTIAAHGYRMQSSVLHIPDRFGFFSPGLPRLQAFQGALFGLVSFHLGITCMLGACIIIWVRARGDPTLALATAMLLIVVGVAALVWIMSCHDRRHLPDYDWGSEDGKLRKE